MTSGCGDSGIKSDIGVISLYASLVLGVLQSNIHAVGSCCSTVPISHAFCGGNS